MARSEILTKARTEIEVEGKSADQVLTDLKSKADQYTRAMVEAQKANDKVGFDKAKKSANEYNQAIRSIQKGTTDVNAVMKNLSGATMNDLIRVQRRLTDELRKTTRGTDEYVKKSKQLQQVSTELRRVRTEMTGVAGAQGSFFGKMANGFNKYFGLIAGGLAALTGLSLGFRKLSEDAMEFQSRVANLSALTGLEGGALDWLAEKAKSLSVGVTEDGVRITKSANDIVDAFTLMGSAKPELLKNKEALALVTTEALKLAEAAKMDTKTAVESLANVMNQFGAGADQASKYINVLAAGSKEGAAAVDSIAASIIKFGPAAASANLSVEESVGLIETLAEKGVKGEIAGTQLRTALLKLQTGADEFNPKVVGLNKALENLSNANLSAGEMVKLFGQEAYMAGAIIINNRDQVDKYTKAVTGTNVATEQAIKNTQTMSARLEQARNRMKLASLELGERLGGALLFSTNMVRKLIKVVIEADKVFTRWRKGVPQSFSDAAIKIQDEQKEVNKLVMQLTDANTKEDDRRRIINQLNSISPTLVKNINAEKISVGQLKDNLAAYNQEATNRIILSNLQVEEEKELAKLAAQRIRVAQFQMAINQDILSANKDIALSEDDFNGKVSKTIEYLKEQVDLQNQLGTAGRETILASGDIVDSRTKEQKLLRNILFLQRVLVDEEEKLSNISSSSQGYQERVNSLKEILGLNKEINLTQGSDGSSEIPDTDGIQIGLEKQKKIFENSIKERKLQLINQYSDQLIIQDEYNKKYESLEWERLYKLRDLLSSFGENTLEIDIEIADKERKEMDAITNQMQLEFDKRMTLDRKAFDEKKLLRDKESAEINKNISDQSKAISDKIAKEIQLEKEKEAELQAIRQQGVIDAINVTADLGANLIAAQIELRGMSAENAEQAKKEMTIMALNALEQIANIAIAQIVAKELGTKSFAGIATAAILGGLVKAAVSAAKAKVNQRYAGKYDVIGQDDGRTYRNVPYQGDMKTGIYSQPTLVGERGSELVVDAGTLRNVSVNFPDVLPKIRASMVPQRAAGNVAERTNQSISQSANQPINQSIDPEMKAILAALASHLSHGISAKINYEHKAHEEDKMSRINSSVSRGG